MKTKIGLLLLVLVVVAFATAEAGAQVKGHHHRYWSPVVVTYSYHGGYYDYSGCCTGTDLGSFGYSLGSFPREVFRGFFSQKEEKCYWIYDSEERKYKICAGQESKAKGPPPEIFKAEGQKSPKD